MRGGSIVFFDTSSKSFKVIFMIREKNINYYTAIFRVFRKWIGKLNNTVCDILPHLLLFCI